MRLRNTSAADTLIERGLGGGAVARLRKVATQGEEKIITPPGQGRKKERRAGFRGQGGAIRARQADTSPVGGSRLE